jgi:hypothetical protein
MLTLNYIRESMPCLDALLAVTAYVRSVTVAVLRALRTTLSQSLHLTRNSYLKHRYLRGAHFRANIRYNSMPAKDII